MIEELLKEAEQFIRNFYSELNKPEQELENRWDEIKRQICSEGYYTHTAEELEYGAKVAWRNSNRCIGRLFWDNLKVIDQRHLNTEEDICEALFEHIDFATNKGRIQPTISVFSQKTPRKKVRIWNHQLIRYAGYRTEQGVAGDPDSIAFTEACTTLGWKPKYGDYDILPLVIQLNDDRPRLYEIPEDLVLEIPIRHPIIWGLKN